MIRKSSLPFLGATAFLLWGVATLLASPAPQGTIRPIPIGTICDPRTPIWSVPFPITQPGSYYFPRNLTGVAGSDGISVQADDVTIDLNGFALYGVPGSLNGIVTVPFHKNLVVRNGTVRNWGGAGINASNVAPSRFQELSVMDNLGVGLLSNDQASIVECSLSFNQGGGLITGGHCRIRDCTAISNGSSASDAGIRTSRDCIATASLADNNAGPGMILGESCKMTTCSADSNQQEGIHLGEDSSAMGCAAHHNLGRGIITDSEATITACAGNHNGLEGINPGDSSTVVGCTTIENAGAGILCNDRCVVVNCSTTLNTLAGIQTQHRCLVSSNVCSDNQFGIRATSASTRLEGNVITFNTAAGIEATGAGSVYVLRNTFNQAAGVPDLNGQSAMAFGDVITTPLGTAITTCEAWSNLRLP